MYQWVTGASALIYGFCQNYNDNYPCADGAYPIGSVALDTQGNFYGTTEEGYYSGTGNGTLYKVASTGTFTALHTFCTLTNCADGLNPSLGVTLARSGEVYGVSWPGSDLPFVGQVFASSPAGTFHDVLTVCPTGTCPAVSGPVSTLLLSNSGSLIGPGPGNGPDYQPGGLYSMTPSGTPSLIYQFCLDSTCHDGGGYNPSPIAESSSGAIYGTFNEGGAGANCTVTAGCGTAFRVTTAHGGTFTKLYDFCSKTSCADGYYPNATILATDGNLYGTTQTGGSHGYGVVFRITSTGHYAVVHSFSAADGYGPSSQPLFEATDGNLYGTTRSTVYRVSLGLAPFVKTVLNAGGAGSTIVILGTDLSGATSVTFNGTSASFTVVSPTENHGHCSQRRDHRRHQGNYARINPEQQRHFRGSAVTLKSCDTDTRC